MKDKLDRFLNRTTTMDTAVTACMVTFLVTLLLAAGWLAIMAGGINNLIQAVKFGQILHVVDRVYIGEADSREIADAGFDAMIEQLGDRWSYYMTQEEYEKYLQVQSNSYTGVGITMRETEKGWLIVSVVADSPADKAGIVPNVYLVAVNGLHLTEESANEIAAMMSADPEHITVVTADEQGTQQQYEMAMEVIYSNPVSYEMKENRVGYIKIDNFDETCAEQAIAAIEDLTAQGVQGLVFDVRNNGGGYLKELTPLLDYLLPEGDIFVSVDHLGNEDITSSDGDYVDLPMVVLVNENSYSAAEFFAAALREYEAAVLVGTPTTGKNRSQTNAILVDGSAVHISSKRYLTPNRIDLTEQGGLLPDVEVAAGENDPQMQAALAQFD